MVRPAGRKEMGGGGGWCGQLAVKKWEEGGWCGPLAVKKWEGGMVRPAGRKEMGGGGDGAARCP